MLYPKESMYREVKNLDGFWSFSPDAADVGEAGGWHNGKFGDDIRQAAVPASYNEQFSDLFNFFGKAWYCKEVFVPFSYADKAVFLRFGSVAGKSKVWVNGQYLGGNTATALPFEFEVSNSLNFGQKNTIVVLADRTLDPWGLPPAAVDASESAYDGYPAVPYDFFPYGGIQRSVYLYTCAKTHITDITIKTELEESQAKVKFEAEFSGPAKGTLLAETDGKTVSFDVDGNKVCGEIVVDNPRLWDVGKPELYDLEFTLKTDSGETDSYIQTYGIREVKIEGNRLTLNGKPVFLTGFGKHEDFAILGKGFSHAVTVRDFELLDWVGANSFRTSHYPYDEQIMDYADQKGILVIDETPFVALRERMYRDDILEEAKSVIRALIKRDKNHPSVVMWSLANEPRIGKGNGVRFFKEMAETAREMDDTRPVTYVGHLEPEDNVYEYFDMVCITKYFGWYFSCGQLEVATQQMRDCVESFYKKFNKPVMIAEFGGDAIPGLHCEPAQMFSEEYQSEFIEKHYNTLKSIDFIAGTHVWCFSDFQATQNTLRAVGNRKGVFTRDRQPKMAAHTLRKLWKEQ